MKILTVNAGSSSLKFNMILLPEEKELISGYFEKIGLSDGIYSIKINGTKVKKEALMKDHKDAIELLIKELLDNHIITSLDEIDGIGHRLVHGGDKYASSVIIDDDVIKTVEELSSLAPLHNPANILGVRAFREALPNTPMVGVFDTAFHQTMGEEQYLYSVPLEWYQKYQIRKYGFHGTSHKYITKVMQEKLGREDINIISCHIGSGGSICAIKNGKSFDTTMGFTPNAGLIMGTRSGDIDYSVIPYYIEKTGTTLNEVDTILNKKSGLFGISGGYSDHRDVEAKMNEGSHEAILANNMYINRIVDYIAKYYVELDGKVDAIVFTAGLGENAREFREEILNKLGSLGIYVDSEKNSQIAGYLDQNEGIISSDSSKVPVYVEPTNEELMIALDTYDLIK
ncbi:acetate kinase [Mycoplasma sp. CAG:776]|nr:acetate kinase [Mycoplasma sp. CAG:776]